MVQKYNYEVAMQRERRVEECQRLHAEILMPLHAVIEGGQQGGWRC
jgi:hypothetical protein